MVGLARREEHVRQQLDVDACLLGRGSAVGAGCDAVVEVHELLYERLAMRLEDAHRPDLWVLAEMPLGELPTGFLADLQRSGHLIVVEEHVAQGGAGQMLAHQLLTRGLAPRQFTHRAALGYVSGLYGSQKFHRAECGLDAESIIALLRTED